jgi:hypothetical protein
MYFFFIFIFLDSSLDMTLLNKTFLSKNEKESTIDNSETSLHFDIFTSESPSIKSRSYKRVDDNDFQTNFIGSGKELTTLTPENVMTSHLPEFENDSNITTLYVDSTEKYFTDLDSLPKFTDREYFNESTDQAKNFNFK